LLAKTESFGNIEEKLASAKCVAKKRSYRRVAASAKSCSRSSSAQLENLMAAAAARRRRKGVKAAVSAREKRVNISYRKRISAKISGQVWRRSVKSKAMAKIGGEKYQHRSGESLEEIGS